MFFSSFQEMVTPITTIVAPTQQVLTKLTSFSCFKLYHQITATSAPQSILQSLVYFIPLFCLPYSVRVVCVAHNRVTVWYRLYDATIFFRGNMLYESVVYQSDLFHFIYFHAVAVTLVMKSGSSIEQVNTTRQQ